jgi:hypothetical protein
VIDEEFLPFTLPDIGEQEIDAVMTPCATAG